jgi:hypothetical protein
LEGVPYKADALSVIEGALSELGVYQGHVIVAELPMFRLHECRDDLWRWLNDINQEVRPDTVLCNEPDHHQDHVALHDEVLRVFFGASVLTFRNLRAQGVLRSNPVYERLERSDVDRKIAALGHYRNLQITDGPATTTYGSKRYMQPEVITAKMVCDGVWCGAEYAEDFGVERLVL